MKDFAFSSSKDQRLLFEEAQRRLGLPAASIEKDFWVCWILKDLFGLPEWGEHLVFKGGTSLSKSWQLIFRFSEDIDVVIDRAFLGFGGETLGSKQRKKLRDECSKVVLNKLGPILDKQLRENLPPDLLCELVPADEHEDPDQQTLLFTYPSVFEGRPGYVRPIVKIEMGARSETEPVENPGIRPYLADAFPDLLKEPVFSVRTISARRTFWEKAMLLHEEGFRPTEKKRKPRLSRHYYDLWCLIGAGVSAQALADMDLFVKVVAHRRVFFRQGWVDYATLAKGSLTIVPLDEQLAEWREDYEAMKGEMFFREPPTFGEIIEVVARFEKEFNEG